MRQKWNVWEQKLCLKRGDISPWSLFVRLYEILQQHHHHHHQCEGGGLCGAPARPGASDKGAAFVIVFIRLSPATWKSPLLFWFHGAPRVGSTVLTALGGCVRDSKEFMWAHSSSTAKDVTQSSWLQFSLCDYYYSKCGHLSSFYWEQISFCLLTKRKTCNL